MSLSAALLAIVAVACLGAGVDASRRADTTIRLRPVRALPKLSMPGRRRPSVLPFLESVERSLRSGASLPQALLESATSDGHRSLAADVRRHGAITALDRWARGAPTGSVESLAAASLALAAATGAATGRAVDGVAATVRLRVALHDEIRALSSQARASAALIALAPIGFLLLSLAIDRDVVGFFASPLGALALVLGLGLDVLGAAWMAQITKAAGS